MENATDALMMGFAVLAFVLALSITINAFSRVTAVTGDMIEAQETTYSDVEYVDNSAVRIVSAETIVPVLYRAYEENYIVRFKDSNGAYNFLKTQGVETNEINLRKMTFGTATRANQFISGLLQGKLTKFEINGEDVDVDFSDRYKLDFNGSSNFYDVLKNNSWQETLGIYYEEDATGEGVDEGVDDVNKTEVRVITYTCNKALGNNN